MNDHDVLREHRIEPIIPAPEFVPNSDLDQLFKQAQAAAREHGWDCPTREEFEANFRKEIAASRKP